MANAVPVFQEIVRLDPRNPQAHRDLGVIYLRCGRPVEATASLAQAVELRPSFENALIHLVDALEADGRRTVAVTACRRLSRVAGEEPVRRYYLAKALALEDKPEEAEKELRRLLLIAPNHPPARHLLGRLLSDRGMFEEAASCLIQIVDVFPNAFQLLADVRRMTNSDRPLLGRMQAILERPDLPPLQRMCVHFGLGKGFDDLGDYAEAMRQYEAGNGLRGMSGRLGRSSLVARFDRMIARFPAEAFPREDDLAAKPNLRGDETPVLIVGMPRSGTTLVEQILSAHRDVADGGELAFWLQRRDALHAVRTDPLDAGALSKAADDYLALLREIGPRALRVTDKNPMNFEALWLIRLALPRARVIHCRRNPIDTCLSIFFMNFGGKHDYAYDRGDLAFYYREYERLMQHWRAALPLDRFTEVEYETLVADPEEETRRLIAFCGLDWE